MKFYRLLGATALTGVALITPSTVSAQTQPSAMQAQSDAASVDASAEPSAQNAPNTAVATGEATATNTGDILVTGSRIRSPNIQSTSPITTVSGEQLFQTGKVSVGDTLNELPQLRNTFSQQNSTVSLGVRGLNLIDLYGLGTQRTLVLVNGRRHVAGDILNSGVSVDINTIPSDLIKDIQILTGGASATYGSDAVAGVVNFVLKDDYDGLSLRGQSGISKYGDAGAQLIGAIAGKNFGGGRGNITVSAEYAHQEDYYASGRPNVKQVNGFVTVDTDPAGSVNGADNVFDRAFFNDIRSTTISTGGQVGIRYRPGLAGAPCGNDAVGTSYTCSYLFQPGGALAQQNGLRVGLGPNGSFINGNGYNSRQGRLLVLSPDLKRYSFNVLGHYEISRAFVPFIEAKYSRSDARGSQSGPFFSQGQTLGDATTVTGVSDFSYFTTGDVNREGIRLDNPYLGAQARATLATQLAAGVNSGVNPNSGAAFGTTAGGLARQNASLAQIADGSYRFSLRRNWLDLGIRDEQIRRETYRIVGGVRGDFNDDWHYELSANYGEFKEKNLIQGNINTQRYLLSVDSTRNAAGQVVCRSQVDPRYAGSDVGGNPAQLAADIAACVPINPFGDGSVSQAARDYLTVASRAQGKITQFDATGFVSGDLSQLFSLPGGPIASVVGGEYRRETNYYDLDDFTQAGYAFYNAIPTLNPPTAFAVKEAFGELRVPLLKDLPLIRELTINGSGRVSDYKGSAGTVYAYSGGIQYRPVEDLMFRGSYSRSVRAPNLGELYSSQSQNFTPAPDDPCSARNLATGSANRVANCNAAGRPAGYDYVYTASLEFVSGGNPNLKAEKSDSYTAGFVVTPSFAPGLSISADYYDITVKDVITATGSPQDILNLCYDATSLDNPFCGLFQRAGANGGPAGEQPFQVLQGSLLQSTANFAKLKVRGVQANVNYNHKFSWGTGFIQAAYVRSIQNDTFTNPADPSFKDRLLGELGDPKNRLTFNAGASVGKIGINYGFRYIGASYLNTYEDYNGLNGLPPQNADYAPIKQYPAVGYHDIRFQADVSDRFNTYIGVDNIGNKQPPYGLTGVTDGSGIYDVRGRYLYVGAVAKF
ncbi:TonB-dependent receptor-like protein [Sphingomonas sp. PP-CE-1A-559]|uniref:TonB-dependent receptor domain-containing protein n=1 Tax=Sphingomonas sp. PP-CE-1A-559 TaxID=2135657 RepID=UPI0010548106|nr:TonB-dependent receptor [Sphingomonas sp. PP-CE-1A-559]TCP83601.1 TonB-dependent receptor-like protein [Sphingomonas sp. PP-CE-1A-559]